MRKVFILLAITLLILTGCSKAESSDSENSQEKEESKILGEGDREYTVIDSTGEETFEILDMKLSEKKSLYLKITKADVDATLEANDEFPYFYLLPGDTSFETVKKSNETLKSQLFEGYMNEISEQEGLTRQDLTNVKLEGEKEGWPKYNPN